MVGGLRTWRDAPSGRDAVVESIDHGSWRVEQRRAALGVIGFVFEGRPNVFADATGVLRGGNTVVFRIGRDALGTAVAIHDHALLPALAGAGLPPGAARLLASPVAGDRAGAVLPPAPGAGRGARDPARPSSSSARSPARPASRSACTAPAEPGWSAGEVRTPSGSQPPCSTRSTARSATRSTSAAWSATARASWSRASWPPLEPRPRARTRRRGSTWSTAATQRFRPGGSNAWWRCSAPRVA